MLDKANTKREASRLTVQVFQIKKGTNNGLLFQKSFCKIFKIILEKGSPHLKHEPAKKQSITRC